MTMTSAVQPSPLEVVLVGAGGGVGWAIRELATLGNVPLITCSRSAGCDIAVDLLSPVSISAAAAAIRARAAGALALVLNAGAGYYGDLSDQPTDVVMEQFQLHVFGYHQLLRELLALGAPIRRIVYVSSAYAAVAQGGKGAYAASKIAGEYLLDAWSQETGIPVVHVRPGGIRTGFRQQARQHLLQLRTGATSRAFAEALLRPPAGVAPDKVAKVVLCAAVGTSARGLVRIGGGARFTSCISLLPRAWARAIMRRVMLLERRP